MCRLRRSRGSGSASLVGTISLKRVDPDNHLMWKPLFYACAAHYLLVVSLHNQGCGAGAAGAGRFARSRKRSRRRRDILLEAGAVLVARSRSRPNVVRLRIPLQNLAGMRSRSQHILPGAGVGATFCSEPEPGPEHGQFSRGGAGVGAVPQICTAPVGAAGAQSRRSGSEVGDWRSELP